MAKSEQKEKYWISDEGAKEVDRILKAYPNKFPFSSSDIQVLFKAGKYEENSGKKYVAIKIVKEPMSLITTKKAIVMITESWWKDVIDSDRTKGLIEGLLTVTSDDAGNIVKRDYDVKTFFELLAQDENEEAALDFSQFEKVLPGSAKLVLQP